MTRDPALAESQLRRLFLVGPMGAGKTSVGRQLATLTGLTFLDSDAEIEARTGVDISFIFEKEGEAGFRSRERAAIAELTQRPDIVLATGGGAVLDPDNRADLATRGYVVYLWTSVDQQLRRTCKTRTRPLLESGSPRQTLERLFADRDPLYAEIADLRVVTDRRRVADVAREIHRQFTQSAGDFG